MTKILNITIKNNLIVSSKLTQTHTHTKEHAPAV